MSESYRWRFEDAAGQPLPSGHSVSFPTQADAEAWFAESWEDLDAEEDSEDAWSLTGRGASW